MKRYFSEMDLGAFWEDSAYALRDYVEPAPTPELIRALEAELGYRLPESYVALMQTHNGGVPVNTCFPADPEVFGDGYVDVRGIAGIGREKPYSLGGRFGTAFWLEEWEYPALGIVVAHTPAGGHELIMLDYRACGPTGEPCVVHVDQERDYAVTVLAADFEAFIRGLVHESVYDDSEACLERALELVAHAPFSDLLTKLVRKTEQPDRVERQIRAICTALIQDKGYFAFHGDERSRLMYDVQFWLYTAGMPGKSRKQYLKDYEKLIAFGGEFSTGGYAPDFVTEWLEDRLQKGWIVEDASGLRFTESAVQALQAQMARFDTEDR